MVRGARGSGGWHTGARGQREREREVIIRAGEAYSEKKGEVKGRGCCAQPKEPALRAMRSHQLVESINKRLSFPAAAAHGSLIAQVFIAGHVCPLIPMRGACF